MLPNVLIVIRDSTAHLVSSPACIVLQECTAIHLGLRSRRVFAARALFLVVVPTLRTALPV